MERICPAEDVGEGGCEHTGIQYMLGVWDMLDKLDVSDKHYDRKYQDMQDRLDNLYDKASELEDTIADIDSQINGAYEKQITAKQLYKILANFDRLYYRLTDLEKKEFLRDFIESVEIHPEKKGNGRIRSR